jgi:hypothetical protein
MNELPQHEAVVYFKNPQWRSFPWQFCLAEIRYAPLEAASNARPSTCIATESIRYATCCPDSAGQSSEKAAMVLNG